MIVTQISTNRPTMARRLWILLDSADMDVSAVFNGGISALIGLWFLLPFATFAGSPSWRAMAAFAPEPVWGLAFLALGLTTVTGVLVADASGDHRLWRDATFGLILFWAFTLTMLASANPVGVSVPIFTSLILLSLNQYRRLVRECRRDE